MDKSLNLFSSGWHARFYFPSAEQFTTVSFSILAHLLGDTVSIELLVLSIGQLGKAVVAAQIAHKIGGGGSGGQLLKNSKSLDM